jgi:hypothetical protein
MKIFLYLVAVVLLCINLSFAQIAHWPLDTDAADIVGDFSGEATTNGVSFVDDDVRGPVMLLDGAEGFVTIPPGLLEGVEDATITCWFNWAGGDNWQRVYSFGNALPSVRTLYLCPQGAHTNESLSLRITIGGQPPEGVFTWNDFMPGPIETDTWYFCACVLKGDSLKLYLNDERVVAADNVLVDPEDLLPDNNNYIGKSHWVDPTYNGKIDDVRFYKNALSEEEIIALLQGTASVNTPKKVVRDFFLEQNYPNPFNPQTTINYTLDKTTNVCLKIYNVSGQEIATLVDGKQGVGVYDVAWQPNGLPSGIYFYKLEADGISETKKMIFQK